MQDLKNILASISKLRFFKPKKSTWESFTVCIGGKLNIIIVSSSFLLYPIYNVYSVRKEVLYFLFIFCVEVQQWNSFSCMFLWLFFSIISRLVFLPSSISSFMRHKNWSNSEVHKQKISLKMKGFDDWGSYSNNTFKVHWKNVHHNTENQHDGGDLNIEIY